MLCRDHPHRKLKLKNRSPLAKDPDSVTFDRILYAQYLQTTWAGRPLYTFDILDSTNSTLWQLIDQGAAPGTTVIALQQQAGRGQWGRQWQSWPGGLYLSLALGQPLAVPATQMGLLTLSSAWGVATVLRDWGIPVKLKWPNDLLVAGLKLGGILTETRLHQGQLSAAIVGIGLNWQNPVPETGINLQTILAEQPQATLTSLEQLAAMTLQGLERGYQHWQTAGTERLLADYLGLLQNLEEIVTVNDQVARVIGVAASGDLRVRLNVAGDHPSPEIHCPPGSIHLRTNL